MAKDAEVERPQHGRARAEVHSVVRDRRQRDLARPTGPVVKHPVVVHPNLAAVIVHVNVRRGDVRVARRLVQSQRPAPVRGPRPLDAVGDDDVLAEDFEFANRVRDTIPRDAKGFIHRLSELLVVCEDKPGVIAEIAVALAGQGVNISDIEVVKVHEGEGGTLRLGFEDDAAADRALAILADHGYRARRP